MPGLIAEAKNLAGDARTSIGNADRLMASANGLALKLDARVDTLTRALASVEEVGVTAREVNDETVPRVNVLVDGLNKDTHALGRVINTLGEQPQSLVFGTLSGVPGPGEPGFTGER